MNPVQFATKLPTFTTKSKRNDCKILSDMKEQALVWFLKSKSCSMQGGTHAEATKCIHDMLCVWEHLNKQCRGVQLYQLISDNGKKFLAKGKLSKSFWWHFENVYPSLTRKKQGHLQQKECLHAQKLWWGNI